MESANLWYSFVRRIICSDNGLTHFGIFSSADPSGTDSPVSRFTTYTFSSISWTHNVQHHLPTKYHHRNTHTPTPTSQLFCRWTLVSQLLPSSCVHLDTTFRQYKLEKCAVISKCRPTLDLPWTRHTVCTWQPCEHVLWPTDLMVSACQGPVIHYISTDFGVDSSSHFSCRTKTDRNTQRNKLRHSWSILHMP